MYLYFELVVILFLIFTRRMVNSAVYENVTVIQTTRHTGHNPPEEVILVNSSDSFGPFISADGFLEVVIIKNQNLSTLVENSFADLHFTEILCITASGVTDIRPGAFRNVPRLQILDLRDNFIKTIRNRVFSNLPMQYLILRNNSVSAIETRAFNNLTLFHLELDENYISRWNNRWFEGSKIHGLSVGFNSIEVLPKKAIPSYDGGEFGALWFLTLNDNKLKFIEEGAFAGWESIGNLDLKNNLLVKFSNGAFGDIARIRNLALDNNRLTELNVEVFRNIEVTFLSLENNNLRCVPLDLINITTSFTANGNPITCKCLDLWRNYRTLLNVDDENCATDLKFTNQQINLL